jgi:hypothetical protein
VQSGKWGQLIAKVYYNDRIRTVTHYVGESLDTDGKVIEPNVAYVIDATGAVRKK